MNSTAQQPAPTQDPDILRANLTAIYGDDPAPGLIERLGITFHEAASDGSRVVVSMPVQGNTQSMGYLHGGASAALAETAGSVAAALHAGPTRYVLGVDLNITHHRSAERGRITAVATTAFCGHSLATHEIVITNEQGQRISTARITNAIRNRRAPTTEAASAAQQQA